MESGAWRFLYDGHQTGVGTSRGGHLARLNQQRSLLHLICVLEQATFRRSGSARTVLIVGASVAWAQEQTRLWKPTDGTSQVRAVDGKHLEFFSVDAAHPAGNVRCFSIRGIHDWVSICGKPGLARWKFVKRSQREPFLGARPPFATQGRKKITNDGYRENHTGGAV